MFCRQCGNELVGDEPFCATCGAPTGAKETQPVRPSQTLRERPTSTDGGEYRSFEYARTTVKNDLAQVAVDCYESLGFELTGQRPSAPGGQITLSFRRSRKVQSKAQLSKIQRSMDDTLTRIANLESEKTKKATSQAIAMGIVSALILGVGMCFSMVWTQFMVLGIVVGIIGIAGCILTWLRFRKTCAQETARINPLIEDAYDRLATLCEEAQAVLRV